MLIPHLKQKEMDAEPGLMYAPISQDMDTS